MQIEKGRQALVMIEAERRQAAVMVVAEDEQGNPIEGWVYVDGVRQEATGKYFRVPVCTQRLDVLSVDGRRWSDRPKLTEGESKRITATVRGVPQGYYFAAPGSAGGAGGAR